MISKLLWALLIIILLLLAGRGNWRGGGHWSHRRDQGGCQGNNYSCCSSSKASWFPEEEGKHSTFPPTEPPKVPVLDPKTHSPVTEDPNFCPKAQVTKFYPTSLKPGHLESHHNSGVPSIAWAKLHNPGMASVYICCVCAYESSQKASVIAHTQHVHLGYVLACHNCNKTYYNGVTAHGQLPQDQLVGLPEPLLNLKIKQELHGALMMCEKQYLSFSLSCLKEFTTWRTVCFCISHHSLTFIITILSFFIISIQTCLLFAKILLKIKGAILFKITINAISIMRTLLSTLYSTANAQQLPTMLSWHSHQLTNKIYIFKH